MRLDLTKIKMMPDYGVSEGRILVILKKKHENIYRSDYVVNIC